jgi:hypothetical protein
MASKLLSIIKEKELQEKLHSKVDISLQWQVVIIKLSNFQSS